MRAKLILSAFAVSAILVGGFSNSHALNLSRLDTLKYDEVCGVDSAGETACYDTRLRAVPLPDTISTFLRPGKPSAISITESVKCGVDTEGVKCFGLNKPDFDLKGLIAESIADTVKTSAGNACGLSKQRKRLRCILSEWNAPATGDFDITAPTEIQAYGVSESLICWAERDLISCKAEPWTWLPPQPLRFNGAIEVITGRDFVCARSQQSGRCWFPKNTSIALTDEFVRAKKWVVGNRDFCALTEESAVLCADFATGGPLPTKVIHTPPPYDQPHSDAVDIWRGTFNDLCVLLGGDGSVKCWNTGWGLPAQVDFSDRGLELHGTTGIPCALLKNGTVECRSRSGHSSRSLVSGGRLRVEFSGYNRCYWNENSIDCPGRTDALDFLKIGTVATSTDGESICVYGSQVKTSRVETTCYGGWSEKVSGVPPLPGPVVQLSVGGDNACAITDNGSSRTLTCWGEGYPGGEPAPAQSFSPNKVKVGFRHACSLDQFGLLCWGQLKDFALEIPTGLEQPGVVVDFALGANRTCAILNTGSIQCWGRAYTVDQDPPPFRAASSIVGSGASLFCALDKITAAKTALHCWGGDSGFPP